MELSVFLAKLIGLYFLIIAGAMLVQKEQFEASAKEMISSKGLIVFTGFISLLLGLAIAIGNPIWEFSYRGLITLISYLAILQGFMRLVFPKKVQEFAQNSFEKGYWIIVSILVILGAFLAYHGFIL